MGFITEMTNSDSKIFENYTSHQAEPVAVPQASSVAKLFIIVFALFYITIALYFVVDCWVHEQKKLKFFLGFPSDKIFPPMFLSAIYTVLGAILGAGALNIISFHRHVAIKHDFQAPHVWGYFVAPWLATILGLVIFALLQSGLLILNGGMSADSKSEVSNLGYLAIGFLSGFGWFQATERIRDIISRFFALSSGENKNKDKLSVAQSEVTKRIEETHQEDQIMVNSNTQQDAKTESH